MSRSARIEKNRLALLAIVAPWFVFCFWHCGRGQKPLPPSLTAHALSIISRVELATGYLLTASVYAAMPRPRRSAGLESKWMCLANLGARHMHDGITVATLYRRLAAVWRILSRLRKIARQWASKLVHFMALRLLRTIKCVSLGTVKPAQPMPLGKIKPP